MKIALHRTQKSGLMGRTTYLLRVRAELTSDERDIINKNGLANELLVYHDKTADATSLASAIIKSMSDTELTVESFVRGTTFTCKNVAELLGIEDEIRQAGLNLRAYIESARQFGGEEVIDVDDELERHMQAKRKGATL